MNVSDFCFKKFVRGKFFDEINNDYTFICVVFFILYHLHSIYKNYIFVILLFIITLAFYNFYVIIILVDRRGNL